MTPELFLGVTLIGACFTFNAYLPARVRGSLTGPSFLAGWLTSELSSHHFAWQLIATVFFVWAGADWMSAPLQRIQVVKGWIDAEGKTHEKVHDVVCSDGLEVDPNGLRCPDNGASVDTTTCETLGETGA